TDGSSQTPPSDTGQTPPAGDGSSGGTGGGTAAGSPGSTPGNGVPTQTSSPQGVPDAGLAALALTLPVNTPNGTVPNLPLNPIARPHGHRKPKPHKPAKPHHAVHRKPHPLASLTGTTPAVVSAPSTHASLTGAMAAVVDAPPSPIATETAPVTPPSS